MAKLYNPDPGDDFDIKNKGGGGDVGTGPVGVTPYDPAGGTDPTNPPNVPVFNWTPPAYTGGAMPKYGPAPMFNPTKFVMPDFSHIQEDPSFQFRLRQGNEALNASAAAKGILRTGGTLKGVEDYGQAAASQEAGNIFDRAIRSYEQGYNLERDMYGAKRDAWLQANHAADLGYAQNYNVWNFGITEERLREQMLMNAMLGAMGQ